MPVVAGLPDPPGGMPGVRGAYRGAALGAAGGAGGWWVIGRAPVPACTVRDLAAAGARLKPLVIPSTMPEAGYRPSAALAEFVRGRDLTSRFPGCDQPAEVCDIDHTVPYPIGPTHPSNLKLYCRAHHQANTRGIARLLFGWSRCDFSLNPPSTAVCTSSWNR